VSEIALTLGIGFGLLCVVVGLAALVVARPRYYPPMPPREDL
jgi:hypothetical protein